MGSLTLALNFKWPNEADIQLLEERCDYCAYFIIRASMLPKLVSFRF